MDVTKSQSRPGPAEPGSEKTRLLEHVQVSLQRAGAENSEEPEVDRCAG
jgi:hypothetical protein